MLLRGADTALVADLRIPWGLFLTETWGLDFWGPCGLVLMDDVAADRADIDGDCCGLDDTRPVNDFRFPRIGFGPAKSGDGGWLVLLADGLMMRGRGLFVEPLFGVDVATHGSVHSCFMTSALRCQQHMYTRCTWCLKALLKHWPQCESKQLPFYFRMQLAREVQGSTTPSRYQGDLCDSHKFKQKVLK